MNTLKSIGAILAGILANAILAIGTDLILIQAGIASAFDENQPWPASSLGIATMYRLLYGIAGGYITAMAAPQKPMKHVVILGILGTLATLIGLLTHLGHPDTWYPAVLTITAFLTSWIGGKILVNQKRNRGN